MRAAPDELKTVLLDVEISPDALTTEPSMDAVAASRSS